MDDETWPAAYPLSPSQERMWFLQRYDPGDPAYTSYILLRLTGRLDVLALERAVAGIIARHEPLRSRFREVDGVPVQEVSDDVPFRFFDRVDLRQHPSPLLAAYDLSKQWSTEPVDLAAPPLLRAGLVRIADEEHIICMGAHHIVSDGWSMAVFYTELTALYREFQAGRPSPLPPLRARFRDYAVLQEANSCGPAADAALEYWTRQLTGAQPLALPADRPRRARERQQGGMLRAAVPADVLEAVARLARAHRVTPYMVWLAGYQLLLCRYGGQESVCVGTPIAGRNRPEYEAMIGYFASTLVLRADLSGDPSFAEFLKRTRSAALGAFSHSEVPFERLTVEFSADRDPTRHPLFQTWFNLHSEVVIDRDFDCGPGMRIDWDTRDGVELVDGAADEITPLDRRYDLLVDVWPGRDDAGLVATYDREMFARETITELFDRFWWLLRAAAADASTPVSRLPLLAPGEQGAVLDNRGGLPDGPGTVVDLFLDRAARTPDAPAIEHGDEVFSYARLAEESAALAEALRSAGIGTGGIVGIHMGQSPARIVAVLGTLRAGAAYLPLDPVYPDARLDFMLRDSGAALVLTDEMVDSALDVPGVPVVRVDELRRGSKAEGRPAPSAPPGPDPGDLAYVIYTSGSTGTPKGVAVEHGGLAARVRWMCAEYPFGPADRVLQFASLSFDTHAEELYPVLSAGGTLVLATVPAELLPEWLPGPAGQSLTVLDLPTAYWHGLVYDLPEQAWPAALRLMIIGGSQADAAAVRVWRERFAGRVELLNTYGPTETTIVATMSRLTEENSAARPPIGRPAAGMAASVLDSGGRPVPVGVPGELYLSGAGIARGYLGRPELTAERFLDDPPADPSTLEDWSGLGPSPSASARTFRTGDLVRLRRDGELEFVGRVDRQVKVRGYRIELGEVEAALCAHPEVAQAVATVRGSGDGDGDATSLVGYLVPVPGAEPAVADIRAHLSRTLPPYLLPNALVLLDHLPLTSNGKPDLAALPAPAEAAPPVREFVAPRTEAEEVVAGIWAEVLGRDKVGALDDFFELGGHSLHATRVTARLRDATGVELPLRVLFEAHTVATVATAVEDLLLAEIDRLTDDDVERMLDDD